VSHITPEELERWWTRGDAADRDRIVGHLAACDECIVRYAAFMDGRPAEAPAGTPAESAAWLGRRVRGTSPVPLVRGLRWRRSQMVAAGAMAALLMVAVLVPALRDRPREPDDLGIRGTRLVLVEPIGAVSAPFEFRWTSPIEAARFRVEISDRNEQPIASSTVAEARWPLPEEIGRQLRPGVEYRWRVVALDAAGEPMMQSELRSFAIRD
jgi:hypothetical protein